MSLLGGGGEIERCHCLVGEERLKDVIAWWGRRD